MSKEQFLKETDLAKIRTDFAEVQKLKMTSKNAGLQIENMNLKIALSAKTKENYELQLADLQRQNEDLKQKLQARVEQHAELVKNVAKEYGIEDQKWGFHPDTGEIFLNN